MNAYKVTVTTENKNTKTNKTSVTPVSEQYFGSYRNADSYAKTFGNLEIFGDITNIGAETRQGNYEADPYAGIFETSELVSRTVINIAIVKIN